MSCSNTIVINDDTAGAAPGPGAAAAAAHDRGDFFPLVRQPFQDAADTVSRRWQRPWLHVYMRCLCPRAARLLEGAQWSEQSAPGMSLQ